MFVPAPLFPGARVALVGPSSAVSEERLRRADALVSALGLKPVYYPSCLYQSRDGYLAATDAQRAQDIMRAFESDAIDGIWCLRGGYGAHRILPLLDAAVIRKHRKWFGGYSDVTALHTFLNQKCGLEIGAVNTMLYKNMPAPACEDIAIFWYLKFPETDGKA